MTGKNITLAITGATGAAFAVAVLRRLSENPLVGQVNLLLSTIGRRCVEDEVGLTQEDLVGLSPKVQHLYEHDLGACISSGSYRKDGMVVLPCSAGTLGRIASGTSENLVARAADVCLKERHPLILCVRETPFNRIHMENMLRVHDAGAMVMPLMPSFYHRPQVLDDLYEAFATRVLDHLGLMEEDTRRWKG